MFLVVPNCFELSSTEAVCCEAPPPSHNHADLDRISRISCPCHVLVPLGRQFRPRRCDVRPNPSHGHPRGAQSSLVWSSRVFVPGWRHDADAVAMERGCPSRTQALMGLPTRRSRV